MGNTLRSADAYHPARMMTAQWRTDWLARVRTLVPAVLILLPFTAAATAESAGQDPADFTVDSIELEGLQRISEGTVYNYLPINIGDHVSRQRIREAIRALYASGFFRDVQMRRASGTLVVVVLERPSIESFEITGNKDIKTEDLQKSLRGAGLAAGKTFDRSVLEDVASYLTDQYFSRGKYSVRVQTKIEEETGNRVRIKIDIHEGKRAKVREINLIGATKFRQQDILASLQLKTPNWLSWYKQDDRYSRETLQGDLERIRDYYMDRGYANFNIESTQVSVSPEKDDIYIAVNIDEGAVFKLGEIKLAGTFVVPRQELEQLLLVAPGQIFDRKLISSTQQLIQNRLGRDGYAFAKVEPVPTPDNLNHTVQLTFFIDPGNRVYVRNITFSGTNRVDDEVLRRELRQLEGGWLSNTSLERSKQRLQRLPYIKQVDFETTPVTGTPDEVDVNFKMEDAAASTLSGGIGYSQVYGFSINGSYVDANVLGTGDRDAIEAMVGKYNKVLSLSQTDPYVTTDGLARTLSVSYSNTSRFTADASEFSTKTYQVGFNFAYPISEYQVARLGLNYAHTDLDTITTYSSDQLQDWLRNNGSPYFSSVGSSYVQGTIYDAVEASAGWAYDSRDRTLFPTTGALHSLGLTVTVPGLGVEYAIANYQYLQFIHLPLPFIGSVPISVNTRLGYGTALGDTTALPPNRDFFLGGPDSVRGFREGTLGPRDSRGYPYGGDTSLSTQVDAILPMPAKFATSARASLFFDAGNAFYYGKVLFKDQAGFYTSYHFNPQQLRTSAGVAVQWLSPMGLFRFSLGFPINYQHNTWKYYGDETEMFQFSIGNAF